MVSFTSSGTTVLSYVNMVCGSLRNSIPKSIVYCQVREAKRSLLDHFFTDLGKKEVNPPSLPKQSEMEYLCVNHLLLEESSRKWYIMYRKNMKIKKGNSYWNKWATWLNRGSSWENCWMRIRLSCSGASPLPRDWSCTELLKQRSIQSHGRNRDSMDHVACAFCPSLPTLHYYLYIVLSLCVTIILCMLNSTDI